LNSESPAAVGAFAFPGSNISRAMSPCNLQKLIAFENALSSLFALKPDEAVTEVRRVVRVVSGSKAHLRTRCDAGISVARLATRVRLAAPPIRGWRASRAFRPTTA
jgi:hypothetical protein